MKVMLSKFIMIISSVTFMLKTPMSMGLMLMIQTILSTMFLSKIMISSWMPMVIFLMLIGGLLILFMYMSSIASNEKFNMNILLSAFLIILIVPLEEMLSETQMNEKTNNFLSIESITLMKIYNKKTMLITLMLFIYLLLTMVVVTFIIKIYKGPLRSTK